MVYDFIQGTTDTLQFQFIENGVPIDLSSSAVTILVEDRTGTSVANPGTIVITDAANGKVQFTATNTTTFTAANAPYFVRWKITHNIDGGIAYIPSTERDVWNVMGI
jgi:hypothetical protein